MATTTTTTVHIEEGLPQPNLEDLGTIVSDVLQPVESLKSDHKDDLNIPPEGVHFRLKSRDSEHVMYSRGETDPLVGHYIGPEYSDQIFTLIYGKYDRNGLYAIKSWECGKVLFSRNTEKPYVGNIYGDGDYPDNWFKFEQDKYDKESFRIYCPYSDSVIYSRSSEDPTFSNYTGPKYDDQLWRFVMVDQ